MSIRVAIDATPLLGAPTGVGAFVAGVLPELARRPTEIDLLAYGLTWQGRGRLRRVVPSGVATARAPMVAGPLLRSWARSSVPAVEWWTGPVDVVHGTNFVVPPSRRGAEVVTVHDLTAVRFPELCTPTSLTYPHLVRRALARGAWVHTPSAFVAAEVVELLGADPERVRAIPHGVVAPPGGVVDQPSDDPGGSDRYVLALGTAEPRKDLPSLVRAFDRVAGDRPDVHLVLAGPGGWGEDALDEAISAAAHAGRISRLGYLDPRRRAAVLAGASVLAFPSIYEGFGLPPLEAMAAGVPVVATRAGAVPEVLGDAGRLVDPGDVDALAGALAAALDEDPGDRAATIGRGRARAALFTWSRCADLLVDLYRDAVLDRSVGTPAL